MERIARRTSVWVIGAVVMAIAVIALIGSYSGGGNGGGGGGY